MMGKANIILFTDTETGGLDELKHSLLSIGLAVWQDGHILASTEIKVKHNPYVVETGALKVNGINLVEHDSQAVTPVEAAKQMEGFLHQYFPVEDKVILGGHNIGFDWNFLRRQLIPNYTGSHKFHHRKQDTMAVIRYLQLSGKLPEFSGLSGALEHFGITCERHTALGDAVATAELFTKLLEVVK